MTARVLPVQRLLFVVLSGLLGGCGSGVTTMAPTNSAFATPPPVAAAEQGPWSGRVELSSVFPVGSCESAYVEKHPEFFAQSATATLQTGGNVARMVLQTSGGQKCLFSGTSSSDTLTLSARHETCEGYPLSLSAITGIVETCHTIDPVGDGPFWDQGKLLARMASSEIDGNWTFDVYDPGASGVISIPGMRLTVEMHVHLSLAPGGTFGTLGPQTSRGI
jgi:hypothetical protein